MQFNLMIMEDILIKANVLSKLLKAIRVINKHIVFSVLDCIWYTNLVNTEVYEKENLDIPKVLFVSLFFQYAAFYTALI